MGATASKNLPCQLRTMALCLIARDSAVAKGHGGSVLQAIGQRETGGYQPKGGQGAKAGSREEPGLFMQGGQATETGGTWMWREGTLSGLQGYSR